MGDVKYVLWNKITVEELKAFLGFCVLMGINSLPALKDYWKRDPVFHYAPIADRITRDRFLEISRYLHFVDNDTLHEIHHHTIGLGKYDHLLIIFHRNSSLCTHHTRKLPSTRQ